MSSCLWNPNFIAMIVYGLLALPVSLLNIWTILSRRKAFKGSFYRIYVVISVHVSRKSGLKEKELRK